MTKRTTAWPPSIEDIARGQAAALGRQVWPGVFERVQVAETPRDRRLPDDSNRYLAILLMVPGTPGDTVSPKPLQRITTGKTVLKALQAMFDNIEECRRRRA